MTTYNTCDVLHKQMHMLRVMIGQQRRKGNLEKAYEYAKELKKLEVERARNELARLEEEYVNM